MVYKTILTCLLLIAVFSQTTDLTIAASPSIASLSYRPPSTTGGGNTGSNSPQNGDIDIDDSEAGSLVRSLFANNPTAAQSLQRSSSPAPTSAPAGATLSASAPSAAMRTSASPSLSSSMSYYPGGYPGYPGYPSNYDWGRWVRVLRCNFNNYNGGFCCSYVWVWRYW